MNESISHANADESVSAEPSVRTRHSNHCFVVMPFGRTPDEQRWFRGWYQTVIEPAITSSGLEPILSASEDHPAAINDEIRAHLVFDPMVIVDLGGVTADEAPNPNVMYELGIRHAFGLPVVIMAWEGQRLPFDVSNQRAIMSRRDFMEIDPTRHKLVRFIKAAQEGRYYNPMETVGREAAIEAASLVLGEESLLGALAKEVRELRGAFNARQIEQGKWKKRHKVKAALGKADRPALWSIAQQLGLDATLWSRFLATAIPPEMQEEMHGWSFEDWTNYLKMKAPDLVANAKARRSSEPVQTGIPEAVATDDVGASAELLDQIAVLLPKQPWPTGVHREIAEKMNLPAKQVSAAIQELIRSGKFYNQIDGVVMAPIGVAKKSIVAEHDRGLTRTSIVSGPSKSN